MPEDVPLLYAGLRVSDGSFAILPTMVVAFLGVLVRDTLAWTLGRQLGDRLLEAEWAQRWLPIDRIEDARMIIADRGGSAVVMGRFMLGVRVPMFLAAGASGIPLATFLAWDLAAMVVSIPVLVTAGYYVGPPILDVARSVIGSATGLWAVLGLVAGGVLAVRWWRARSAAEDAPGPPDDDPTSAT